MKKATMLLSVPVLLSLLCGCGQIGRRTDAAAVEAGDVIQSAAESSKAPEATHYIAPEATHYIAPDAASDVPLDEEDSADEDVNDDTEYYDPPANVPEGAEPAVVTREKYAKAAPYPNANRSTFYRAWQTVYVVDETATGYCELENGDFISSKYIKRSSDPVRAWSVDGYDPADADGEIQRYYGDYDPLSALDYAAEHWQEETSLCAEFASECLTAGGLSYDIASATDLYNALVRDNAGTPVETETEPDGTLTLPDCARRGDLIFYYCARENQMVHVAVYNGDTADGKAKAYAHNPNENGSDAFSYEKYCPGYCGYSLDKVVLFCLDSI